MKAIKGLEDRLYALDQMIASCKKLVNEQKELAQVRGSESVGDKHHNMTVSAYGHMLTYSLAGISGQSEAG